MVAFSLNVRTEETKNLDDGSLITLELSQVEVKTLLDLVRSEAYNHAETMPMDRLEVLDDILEVLKKTLEGAAPAEPEGNWTNTRYIP